MIPVLLQKDPAVRTLPLIALAGTAFGALFVWSSGATRSMLDGDFASYFVVPAIVQCLAISALVVLGPGSIRTRWEEMHLALPVSGRTWVLVRALACTLVGWVPVVCMATVFQLADGDGATTEAFGARTLSAAAAWTAWVGLFFAWRPERARVDSIPAVVVLVAVGVGLLAASLTWPVPAVFGCAAVLVVAAIRIGTGVPSRLQLAIQAQPTGAKGAHDEPAVTPDAGDAALGADRAMRRWLARSTHFNPRHLGLLIGVFGMGVITLGGSTSAFFWFSFFYFGVSLASATRVLRETDHLPIPRARIAPWVVVPPLAALIGGVVLGTVLESYSGPKFRERIDLVGIGEREGARPRAQMIQVPGALQRFTLGTGAREVRAPWGEVARVEPLPIVPGLPFGVFNPYGIDEESSIDFVAWQLSRAIEAGHGTDVEPAQLRDEYLSVLNGVVVGPFFGQKFLKAHPEAGRPKRRGMVAATLLGSLVLWVIGATFATRRGVPPGSPATWRRRRLVAGGLIAVGVLMFLGPMVLPIMERRYPNLVQVLGAALADLTSGRTWLFAPVIVAATVAGYAWTARRFARMEVPPPVKRPALPSQA